MEDVPSNAISIFVIQFQIVGLLVKKVQDDSIEYLDNVTNIWNNPTLKDKLNDTFFHFPSTTRTTFSISHFSPQKKIKNRIYDNFTLWYSSKAFRV